MRCLVLPCRRHVLLAASLFICESEAAGLNGKNSPNKRKKEKEYTANKKEKKEQMSEKQETKRDFFLIPENPCRYVFLLYFIQSLLAFLPFALSSAKVNS